MRFESLASGSAGNLYTVAPGAHDEAELLIDPGLPLRSFLGSLLSPPRAAIVSHLHADHCRGARGLAALGVPVWLPGEALDDGGGWPEEVERPTGGLEASVVAVPPPNTYRPWTSFAPSPSFVVKAWPQVHDVPCFGFTVLERATGEVLIYSIDTAYTSRRFGWPPPTIVAVEANHDAALLAGSSAHVARRRRVARGHQSIQHALRWLGCLDLSRCREIVLIHLSAEHADPAAMVSAVRRATGVHTWAAAPDGGAIDLEGDSQP